MIVENQLLIKFDPNVRPSHKTPQIADSTSFDPVDSGYVHETTEDNSVVSAEFALGNTDNLSDAGGERSDILERQIEQNILRRGLIGPVKLTEPLNLSQYLGWTTEQSSVVQDHLQEATDAVSSYADTLEQQIGQIMLRLGRTDPVKPSKPLNLSHLLGGTAEKPSAVQDHLQETTGVVSSYADILKWQI